MKIKAIAAFTCSTLAAGGVGAESRELDAHQHGHGALNIAFEGKTVAMELEAPGADIVGFEYPAKTAEDRAKVDAAIAVLAKPLDLFQVPSAAGCVVTAANVALIGEEDHHDEEHHDDGHKDHGEHSEDDHQEHDEDHAAEGEGHTEFHAEYTLTCDDPASIDVIEFAYFATFPDAQELDIQMISEKGAKGFEVERGEPQLNLSGAI